MPGIKRPRRASPGPRRPSRRAGRSRPSRGSRRRVGGAAFQGSYPRKPPEIALPPAFVDQLRLDQRQSKSKVAPGDQLVPRAPRTLMLGRRIRNAGVEGLKRHQRARRARRKAIEGVADRPPQATRSRRRRLCLGSGSSCTGQRRNESRSARKGPHRHLRASQSRGGARPESGDRVTAARFGALHAAVRRNGLGNDGLTGSCASGSGRTARST